MPQLEIAHFASQIFWLVITFLVLYIVMAKMALPKVRQTLQNRQDKINSDLTSAEELKEEAKLAEEEYNMAIQKAKEKAHSITAQTQKKIKEQEDMRNAKLDETLARQAKEAEHRITALKKETAEKLAPITAEFVCAAIKKLTDIKVDTKEAQIAIEKVQQ